jgi:glyoxylase-like metal-dependent hydrolase (beta-lactamase superfamily II)/rhodanese-related sulfurtransferase
MEIVRIDTTALGDRSYLVTDGAVAVVVDPQRDIDRVLAAAGARAVRITHVLETHMHNDYVSGGLALAQVTGASYGVSAAETVGFTRLPLHDGDELATGSLSVTVVATPGHTPHHLSYVIRDGGGTVAAFTGGSLVHGSVGRTDLCGDDATEAMARMQHRSVRALAAALPASTLVMPTHGFGSFCAASATAATGGTLGDERGVNLALVVDDEDAFVPTLVAGFTAYPRYYAHMGPINRHGPAPIDLTPLPRLAAEEVRRRIRRGDWVVDLRQRRSFAAGHVPGTVNVELADPFATYLAWVVPWGAPVTLLAADAGDIAAAQRALARVGIDRPAGAAVGDPSVWASDLTTYRVATFADLARVATAAAVLDVRRDDEWQGGHVRGATHIHLPDVPARVDKVSPAAAEVWVHCAGGFRASIAASLLSRAGHSPVLVDDDWSRAAAAGCDVVMDESVLR